MGKKPYVKPDVIDLSLEGLTGIGADSCNTGGAYSAGACTLGFAAGTGCGSGSAYSGTCSNGTNPNSVPGSICTAGGTATSACGLGSSNTGVHSVCYDGTTAAYQENCGGGSTVGNCETGATDGILCKAGNAQTPHTS
ncbi:MAG: hypothetical protein HQK60_20315 [Deltaproteobacteria bacterium]|nr:hypothetical protein [Deltaproteobacteria bacterium]